MDALGKSQAGPGCQPPQGEVEIETQPGKSSKTAGMSTVDGIVHWSNRRRAHFLVSPAAPDRKAGGFDYHQGRQSVQFGLYSLGLQG
jgi:hypothetical protein